MKHISKSIAIIGFLFLIISTTKAQFSETLFYDSLSKVSNDGYIRSGIAEGKFIYLSGSSFSEQAPLPTITKMDTSGSVIWTAIDNDNYGRFGNYHGFENTMASCKETLKSGNRIYTIAESYNQYTQPIVNEVWCISDSSGTLLWKVGLNDQHIVKIADYSSTELLVITGTYAYNYLVINKMTGAVVFSKHFGTAGVSLTNNPNIFVDNNKNILLSWDDTCRKFRDSRLNSLAWTSNIPYDGRLTMIDKVTQDSGRYIFMGRNNVRSVDTSGGNTVWFSRIQVGFVLGIQSGDDGVPKDFMLRDSVLYVSWRSAYVGGVNLERGFTLTRINKYNGTTSYNVAYDFSGIPVDPPPQYTSELDWPMQMCMDENKQIYMIGSYDRAPGAESPGNWGIMKINSQTGSKIYEATITDDSTKRSERSQGKFICYYNGKMYGAGNLEKKENYVYAKPVLLSFDTSSGYTERLRISPTYTVRYSSSLIGLSSIGSSKMVLLKKVGRSGIIELRNSNNQLLWSRLFSSKGKFMIPQNIKNLSDTAIIASFTLFLQDTTTKILADKPDSLIFVSLDTAGNTTFTHSIKYNETDTLSGVQIYSDNVGRTNFIFRNKLASTFSYQGYMLKGAATSLNYISIYSELYDTEDPVVRTNPFQHYNGDTLVIHQKPIYTGSNGWLLSPTQLSTGYKYYNRKPLRSFAKIFSSLKLDSVSFLIMGRDSSEQILAARYDYRLSNPIVWSYNPAVKGTMYNADSSSTSLFTVSKNNNGNKLILSKLNRQTGVLNWNIEKTPQTNTAILPVDFKYDPVNHYYITGGYIADSSISGVKTSYFYITLDSGGNIIKDVVKQGYGMHGTKINIVNVLPNGTHLYGGSISTGDWGIAGFYNSDCFSNNLIPSVSITTPDTTVCKNTTVKFTATSIHGGDNPFYQWQVNNINAGINTDTFITSTLNNNDQVKVLLTSNAQCLQLSTASSNLITITVNPQLTPAVSISGDTSVIQGQYVFITSTPLNAGVNPTYQWQDSTNTHNWQNITGAINTTINYTPALTGDKIKCVINSYATCTSSNSAASNKISFTLKTAVVIDSLSAANYAIKYYPNPVHNSFTIDSLRISDQWQTLTIITINGNQPIASININNQARVTLNVQNLSEGLYIAILRGKQGEAFYLKFIKL